jgi:hypothetical protein
MKSWVIVFHYMGFFSSDDFALIFWGWVGYFFKVMEKSSSMISKNDAEGMKNVSLSDWR